MGVPFWRDDVAIASEDVTVTFLRGRPVAINGVDLDAPWRSCTRRTRSAAATGSG